MTTTAIRPVSGAHYVPRGTCLGRLNPDCTAKRHGTYSAYWHGCRCPHARNDYRLYQKRKRQGREKPRLINATGTQRRIRALWAIGHNSETIGAAAGYTAMHIQRIARCRDYVTNGTWYAIDRAYRTLADVPGTSDHARGRARRAGYAPPICWDDDTIDDPAAQPAGLTEADSRPDDTYDEITVQLACDGHLTHAQLTHRPDLVETVRRLARRMSDLDIAHHLHWPGADTPAGSQGRRTRAQESIVQIRARHGIPALVRPTLPVEHRSTRERRARRAVQQHQAA